MKSGVHEIERERQRHGNLKEGTQGTQVTQVTQVTPIEGGPARKRHLPRPLGGMPQERRTVDQRVIIAIDVQNLYYGAKDLYGTKVAYQKFLEKVLNGRKMVRSIAYIANRDGNNQGSFIKLMRGIGCDIRQKQVIERSNGMKCNWDVEIAVDALAMAPRVDTFILASGDGDFTYLLQALRMQGVKTEVVAFRANTSHMLIEEADEYRDISRDMLIDNAKAWKKLPKSLQKNEPEDHLPSIEIEDEPENDEFYEEPEYDDSKKRQEGRHHGPQDLGFGVGLPCPQ